LALGDIFVVELMLLTNYILNDVAAMKSSSQVIYWILNRSLHTWNNRLIRSENRIENIKGWSIGLENQIKNIKGAEHFEWSVSRIFWRPRRLSLKNENIRCDNNNKTSEVCVRSIYKNTQFKLKRLHFFLESSWKYEQICNPIFKFSVIREKR